MKDALLATEKNSINIFRVSAPVAATSVLREASSIVPVHSQPARFDES